MKYKNIDMNPDKVSTVRLDEKSYNRLIRFYNKRRNLSNDTIYLSGIIREAISQKVEKIKLTKKKIPKKLKMEKKVNFKTTNDMWKRTKLCAEQTSKSQNDFVRNCINEYLDKN